MDWPHSHPPTQGAPVILTLNLLSDIIMFPKFPSLLVICIMVEICYNILILKNEDNTEKILSVAKADVQLEHAGTAILIKKRLRQIWICGQAPTILSFPGIPSPTLPTQPLPRGLLDIPQSSNQRVEVLISGPARLCTRLTARIQCDSSFINITSA